MNHYEEGPVARAHWMPVVPAAPVIPTFALCCMKGTGAKCGESMGFMSTSTGAARGASRLGRVD